MKNSLRTAINAEKMDKSNRPVSPNKDKQPAEGWDLFANSETSSIYENIVQSPAPICMFYFSHPFGVSSPLANVPVSCGATGSATVRRRTVGRDLSSSFGIRHRGISASAESHKDNNGIIESIDPDCGLIREDVPTTGKQEKEEDEAKQDEEEEKDHIRLASFIPWPRNTWTRSNFVPPLVEIVAKRNAMTTGHQLPDLESILRVVRVAWNTPPTPQTSFFGFSRYNSELFLKNLGQFESGEKKLKKEKGKGEDSGGSGQVLCDGDARYSRITNPAINDYFEARKNHLQRRYSVPEIIMRRHWLQEASGESVEVTTTPYFLVRLLQSSTAATTIDHHNHRNKGNTFEENAKECGFPQGDDVQPTPTPTPLSTFPCCAVGTGAGTNQNETSNLVIDSRKSRDLDSAVSWSASTTGRLSRCPTVFTESVYCENCHLRLYTGRKLLSAEFSDRLSTRRMDYFYNLEEANAKPRRKYKNDLFMTSADSSLLVATTEPQDHVSTTSETAVDHNLSPVPPNEVDLKQALVTVEENGTTDIVEQEERLEEDEGNEEPPSAVDEVLNPPGDSELITTTTTMITKTPSSTIANETVQVEMKLSNPSNEDSNQFDYCEQNIMCLHFEPRHSQLHHHHAPIKLSCDCGFNLDQYISQMLIGNLQNNRLNGMNAGNNNDGRNEAGNGNEDDGITYRTDENFAEPENGNEFRGQNGQEHDCLNNPQSSSPPLSTIEISGCPEKVTYVPYSGQGQEEVVIGPVTSGSVYPDGDFDKPLLVPRLSAFPRSESMEVHSSAASCHEDFFHPLESEENESLVDSLEGSVITPTTRKSFESGSHNNPPLIPSSNNSTPQNNPQDLDERPVPVKCEKPEAFFVPIGFNQYQEDLNIARKMPDTIREKLNGRQRRRNFKREQELVRKRHLQKFIEMKLERKIAEMNVAGPNESRTRASFKGKSQQIETVKSSGQKSEFVITKYHPAVIPLSPDMSTTPEPLSSSHRRVPKKTKKSDIGSLKSYTIDSRGNMQFHEPSQGSGSKEIATRKASTGKPKKKILASRNIVPSLHKEPKKKTDFQHMTLYQSSNLTPDTDRGPRRIYQKTEIQDGEKRIEILEIVECAGSSSNSCTPKYPSHRNSGKSSRIPRPVSKIPQFAYRPQYSMTMTSSSSQENLDPDQNITDLLVNNLRTNSKAVELHNYSDQRTASSRRPVTGPKYQQFFEVIPEEKTGTSFESSTEEGSGRQKVKKSRAFTVIDDQNESNRQTVSIPKDVPKTEARRNNDKDNTPVQELSAKNATNTNDGNKSESTDKLESLVNSSADIKFSINDKPSRISSHEESPMNGTVETFRTEDNDNNGRSDNKDNESSGQESGVIIHGIGGASELSFILTSGVNGSERLSADQRLEDETIDDDATMSRNGGSEKRPNGGRDAKYNNESVSTGLLNSPIKEREFKEFGTMTDGEFNQTFEAAFKPKHHNSTPTEPSLFSFDSRNVSQFSSAKQEQTCVSSEVNSGGGVGTTIKGIDVEMQTSPSLRREVGTETFELDEERRRGGGNENKSSSVGNKTPYSGARCCSFFCQFCETHLRSNSSHNQHTGMCTAVPTPMTMETLPRCDSCCDCRIEMNATKPENKCLATSLGRDNEEISGCDTAKSHNYYQITSKLDHSHTETKSNNNQLLSSHCIKTNERIQRLIPSPLEALEIPAQQQQPTDEIPLKSKMNRPKIVSTSNLIPKSDNLIDKTVLTKLSQTKPVLESILSEDKAIRLPSATPTKGGSDLKEKINTRQQQEAVAEDKHDGDSSDSTTDFAKSSSLSENENENRQKRFYQTANPDSRLPNLKLARCRRKRRKSHHVGTEIGQRNGLSLHPISSGNSKDVSMNQSLNNNGWSVTVAGCYHPAMAPDLEMRLSFPKAASSSSGLADLSNQSKAFQQSDFSLAKLPPQEKLTPATSLPDLDLGNQSEVTITDNLKQALPSINCRPPKAPNQRRTLMRQGNNRQNLLTADSYLATDEKTVSRKCKSMKQTARKSVQKVECNLAVESSATTKTVSKITKGRRAFSYSSLPPPSEESISQYHQQHLHNYPQFRQQQNSSLYQHSSRKAKGFSSSRRMSLESQGLEMEPGPGLSVLGNAIAPELKPPVPTMSEKDLTRRHSSCFTRNRSFYS